jgi:hypothetical protein
MTELAVRQQRRTLGGPRWRAAVESATWPLRKAAWVIEEKVIWAGADAARGRLETVRWPFEQIAWRLERRLIWPAQDALRERGMLGRSMTALACIAIAGAAVAAGLLVARDSSSDAPRQAPAPTIAIAPATKVAAAPAKPDPTLQGAPPNFESSPATGESAAETAARPSAAPASAESTRQVEVPPSSIPAAPGGEKHALRAARHFAAAFVLYEIGEEKAKVRRVFARTATPALLEALRARPPRLPGEVDVPEARVANVILGERRRKQIDASVSLLRLGNLSELRLTLTKDRKRGWAVSEVRG